MKQKELPFLAQDGEEARELRNLLGLAVSRLHGIEGRKMTLHVREFLMWIFNATHHGLGGQLKKSYLELSQVPWGLCCCEDTVRRAVRLLRRHRLIVVEESRYQSDGQSANGYALDWDGIRSFLGLRQSQSGWSLQERPGVQEAHPYKEITPLPDSLLNSGPDPEGRGPPRLEHFTSGKEPSSGGTAVRDELLTTIPELIAAAAIEIEPAEGGPGDCQYGVFAPLTACEIAKPLGLVGWFRRQLASPRPATGNTEADLLLVIAAALFVRSLPRDDVRRPVGKLVDVISRGVWYRALPFVPEARKLLDGAVAACGPEPLGRRARVVASS